MLLLLLLAMRSATALLPINLPLVVAVVVMAVALLPNRSTYYSIQGHMPMLICKHTHSGRPLLTLPMCQLSMARCQVTMVPFHKSTLLLQLVIITCHLPRLPTRTFTPPCTHLHTCTTITITTMVLPPLQQQLLLQQQEARVATMQAWAQCLRISPSRQDNTWPITSLTRTTSIRTCTVTCTHRRPRCRLTIYTPCHAGSHTATHMCQPTPPTSPRYTRPLGLCWERMLAVQCRVTRAVALCGRRGRWAWLSQQEVPRLLLVLNMPLGEGCRCASSSSSHRGGDSNKSSSSKVCTTAVRVCAHSDRFGL